MTNLIEGVKPMTNVPDEIPDVTGVAAIAAALQREKIDQLGFIVEDLEAGKKIWGQLFPGEEWLTLEVDAAHLTEASYRGQPGKYAMNLCVIGRNPQVELIQPITGPSVYHDWVAEHGYGLHHFGFLTDDVPGVVAEIEATGLNKVFSGDGARPDGSGAYAYFELDDFPLLIEIIETRPGARLADTKQVSA